MMMKRCCGVHPLGMAIRILMLGLLLAGSANAATLTVCPSGCSYSSIQSAINASNTGDTILVQSGTYSENVNVTKKLTLRGTGNPVVNTSGSASGITLSANGITLEGFTVKGSFIYEAGINMNSGSKTLNVNNPLYYGAYGIYISSSNNTLKGNKVSNIADIGIYLYFSNNNTLSGNNVSNSYPGGIYLEQSSRNNLSGNNVSNNYDIGIYLSYYSDNNTLTGNNVSSTIPIYYGSGHGIILMGGNNTMIGNNIWDNKFGISLPSSGNNTLKNNKMNINRYNFASGESSDSVFNNHIDTTNLADGKSIYYIIGAKNTIYDSSANIGTFYCINCINVTLKNLELKNNEYGIFFWNTTRSKIQNVNISNNYHGISLSSSNNNTLTGNYAGINCGDNGYGNGILLTSSRNNTLSGNNLSENCYGIHLDFESDNNTISNNTAISNYARWNLAAGIGVENSGNNKLMDNKASDNDNGIKLYYSNKNTVKDNVISNNGLSGISLEGDNNILTGNNVSNNGLFYGSAGIYLSYSNNNSIYNNIFNNANNIEFYGSNINKMNITMQPGINIIKGPNISGNFWENPDGTGFGHTCPDVNSDGFCDSPYVPDANNTDYLPLSYKLPSIYFIYPTPADGANLTQNYAYINTTVIGSTAFIDWNRSLAGWWRFNNESGENASFFRDWSRKGNNASCSGTNCSVVTSGKFGNALGFDGINDYVNAGNGESLNITGAITIETWINPAIAQEKCIGGASGNYGVMSKVSGPANSANWSWQLRYGAPGGGCYLGFNFNGNPEGSKWVTVKQNLTAGQWYHIAGTFNGTDINSYLNGNLVETNKISAIKGYRNKLIIGTDGWNNAFGGKIDEIRIHKRALSPEEIRASYNAGMYRLYRNFTDLAVGSYNYQAYTQNLQGNLNQTETRTFNRVRPTGTISGSVRIV